MSKKETVKIEEVKKVEKKEARAQAKAEKEMQMKKEERKEKLKVILTHAFNITFWVVLVGLIILWGSEMLTVRGGNNPKFCLNETTHQFEDGQVYECNGLGYKVFIYDRDSIQAAEFGPFFIEMKK